MNICLIFQKSQKQFELQGISQASSSHRSNTGSIAKTCSRSNGSTSKSSTSGKAGNRGSGNASAIANSSHRGGGNGSSVGDSGLNGDRNLGAGSPWDLLGNRGAHLTGNLGALLNRHLDGDLDWDGVALLHRAGVAHLVDHGVGDGVADGGGPGATHGPGHLPGDGHTDGVGDLTGSLNGPGVAHPPCLSMAVGGRCVSSNKRGSTSSVSGSVESISLRLGISLTLGNTMVHQTSTITDSLNSSGNTDSSSSRGDSNASNTGSVSDNVGGVGNTDGSLGADLLGDVLAVLDGGGVNDGGDLLVALLLLDHINNVVALGLLSRGADLLGDGPGHGMALLHRTAGASLLGPGLGLGDGPGVADGLGDSGALLGGDGVIGGLAVGGSGNPLGNHSRGSGNTNCATSIAKSSSSVETDLGISIGKGTATNGKENHKLLHYDLILLDFPQWMTELKCRIQVFIGLL